jgi:antitoxin ParD1/3/4
MNIPKEKWIMSQTINLDKYWNTFIDGMLNSGRYTSASELVQESLRLLEDKEKNSQLKQLREALIAGEQSGDAGILDIEEIKKQAKLKVGIC